MPSQHLMLRQAPNAQRHTQRGFVAVLFIVMMAMAAMAAVTANLWGNVDAATTYERKLTRDTLKQAKEALLGYVELGTATGYTTVQTGQGGTSPNDPADGRLVCVDLDGDGVANVSCGAHQTIRGNHALGLFPWSTLGLPRLKDGSNECLWYALSGDFKTNPPTRPLNADSFGEFSIIQPVKQIAPKTGAVTWSERLLAGNTKNTANSPDRVVAVIIAPGAALRTQNRKALASSNTCPLTKTAAGKPNAEASASAYLEKYTGSLSGDNSVITVAEVASRKTWVQADENHEKLNDELIWITADEFAQAVNKRALRRYRLAIESYVYGYYDDTATVYQSGQGFYPSAASQPSGECVKGRLQGYVPSKCNGVDLTIQNQTTLDGWAAQTHYAVSENCISPAPIGQTLRKPPFTPTNLPTTVCNPGARITVGTDTTSVQALILMRGRPRTGQLACDTFATMFNCIENPINQAAVLAGNALVAPFPATVAPSTYMPITTGSNDLLYLFRQRTQ